ncbi:MAG: protein translocase subunit SecD [Nocardioidaceae bacterium]
MATKTSNPGRTLVIFLLVTAALYAGAASLGSWKPKLGLDLQGGQRITLQAQTTNGSAVTQDKLDQAVDIINNRVNGAGVAEAEISTQGSDIIVVEIPGKPGEDLTSRLAETAQLRFRLVAGQPLPPLGTPAPTAPATTSPATPTAPAGTTTPTPTQKPDTISPPSGGTTSDGQTTDGQTSGKNRPAYGWSSDGSGGGATPTTPPSSDSPTTPDPTSPTTAAPTSPTTAASTSTGPPAALVPPKIEDIPDPYAWTESPPVEWQQLLAQFDCTKDPSQPGQADIPSQPLLACDSDGNRYLLGPVMVDGTDVSGASYGIPSSGVNYVVNVDFNGTGTREFGDVTSKIAGTGRQLAIVLDQEVISAPQNQSPITGGSAEISGSTANPFTETQAKNLANSLKFGALPLSFQIAETSTEGPQLASNQLNAGVFAGIIGLLLVVIYCVLYYRGLSVVIIASLLIAGLLTYAAVLLLAHAYGFTLTLPGIAGFIVAVGITADSFIVYFERLRDEVRDGRTLRTSVETGWVRARTTILAADTVSFLAALVLFIFAIGVVKGFAFALGLSTVIDVFVVFFFTKPMVTMLSRTKFFGQGHKWSGLDRQHLGMPPARRAPRPVGGEA